MSTTFSIEGVGNTASHDFYPPIELHPGKMYVIGMVGFYGCNSIRNIHAGNDKFYYKTESNSVYSKVITIPHGAYELEEISEYIKAHIPTSRFSLRANNNTLKCELSCEFDIDFTQRDCIGRMLGFESKILDANVLHTSALDIQIIKHTNIHIECNLITGSYRNGNRAKVLYEIDVSVPPGYRLDKIPSNTQYLEVNTSRISNITIKLTNQKGELIDFGESEPFTVRLELKEYGVTY
uniref:Uncharacterized protein n=1 Tax=Photinus pyralis TaxID=7054 RepID=A0A1Y1MW23_PHOPY